MALLPDGLLRIGVGAGTRLALPEAAFTSARHSSFCSSPATIVLVPGIMGWAIGTASGPTAWMALA